jgi:hypothetical protein
MTTQRLPRLVAALLAAGTTLMLFSAVVSIAPPQARGELLARAMAPAARQPQPVLAQAAAAASVKVALAAPAGTASAE